jgi:hypothetical protein
MKTTAAYLFTFALPLMLAICGNGQDQQLSPGEAFKALKKEYDRASTSAVPLTDEARIKFVGQSYKHRYAIASKFVELAEKHPSDPVALDALIQAVWQVNTTPWPTELVGEETSRRKAFELILRDHLQSEKLGPLCHRISYGFCTEYEIFLRAVLTKSPHESVRGIACLSLGHFLHNRLQRIDLCREQPKLKKEFAGLFGREYLEALLRQERNNVVMESESLLDRAEKQYGHLSLPYGGTVGERAKAELFEIRHLSIGKPAPEIEGEDQDGKPFRLSDYRGKVVLLDFWSYV